MKLLFSGLLTCVVLAVFLFPVQAKIVVLEKTRYFSVTGKTGKQISMQIRKKRPTSLRKAGAIARTNARFKFSRTDVGVRKNRCVVTRIDIRLSLTYYFPKWVGSKSSSKLLKRKWKAFENELHRHEKVHGKINRDTVKSVERELRKMSGRASPGCLRFSSTVKSKLRALYKKMIAKHKKFDRREQRSSSKIKRLERAYIRAI